MAEQAEAEVKEQGEAAEFSPKVQEVLEKIGEFTLIELSELVDAFEQHFGVTPMAAPMAMMAGAAAPGAAAEEEAVSDEFDVVLKGYGEQKIQVIKAVRAVTTLALKEAKQVVEEVPSAIKEALPKEEADKVAAQLEEAGATVEVKAHAG